MDNKDLLMEYYRNVDRTLPLANSKRVVKPIAEKLKECNCDINKLSNLEDIERYSKQLSLGVVEKAIENVCHIANINNEEMYNKLGIVAVEEILQNKIYSKNIEVLTQNIKGEVENIIVEELIFNFRDSIDIYNLRTIKSDLENGELFLYAKEVERKFKKLFADMFNIDISNKLKGKNGGLFNIEALNDEYALDSQEIHKLHYDRDFLQGKDRYFFSKEEKDFYEILIITFRRLELDSNQNNSYVEFVKMATDNIDKEIGDKKIKTLMLNRLERLTGYSLYQIFINGVKNIDMLGIINNLLKIPSPELRRRMLNNYFKYAKGEVDSFKENIKFIVNFFKELEYIVGRRLDVDFIYRDNPSYWNGSMINRNLDLLDKARNKMKEKLQQY